MAKAKAAPYTGSVVVEFFPGVAQRGYPVELEGEEALSRNISDLLQATLDAEPRTRKLAAVYKALKDEAGEGSAVTVRGKKVNPQKHLLRYLEQATDKETKKGERYKHLEVRVAKPRAGGHFEDYLL